VTPLRELIRLGLPHLRYSPYDSAAWSAALQDPATYVRPDPEAILQALKPFSWKAASDSMARVLDLG
jgi:hypothetical protein